MFPSPGIPTDKIPECRPHIARGEHRRIYRFSPEDFLEIAARLRTAAGLPSAATGLVADAPAPARKPTAPGRARSPKAAKSPHEDGV